MQAKDYYSKCSFTVTKACDRKIINTETCLEPAL